MFVIRRVGAVALMMLCAGCAPVKHVPVVVPATRLTAIQPFFPPQAIRQRHQGTVVLLVLVGVDGRPKDVKVVDSSGFRELDRAAIEAEEVGTYRPKTVDGVPEESYVKFPVNFNLKVVAPPPSTSPYATPGNSGIVPPPPQA